MHYFILAGAHRPQAQSTKVAHWIGSALEQLMPDDTCYIHDLYTHPLPLWSDWMWDTSSEEYKDFQPSWEPLARQMKQADAFIIISPEWSGMATPGVKNFFLYGNPHLMGNKPALLVAVSSGRGGRYPIAELRSSSYKNTQLCYIPQHIIVDHVEQVLNDTALDTAEQADSYIRKRIQYALRMLQAYAIGLAGVRKSGVPDFERYRNGM